MKPLQSFECTNPSPDAGVLCLYGKTLLLFGLMLYWNWILTSYAPHKP